MNITILMPKEQSDFQSFIEMVKYNSPFNENILNFVKDFSNTLLKNKEIKKFPDLVSLAFWMRSANVKKLQSEFENNNKNTIKVARGLIFHIAPSNVDTIFIYSLFLSLLLGNRNIVRLSSKRTERQQILLETLNTLLVKKYSNLKDFCMIVTYEHNDEITKYISSFSKARVIWGGDHTVNTISNIPASVHTLDIKFANKYSYAVLDAKSLGLLSEPDLKELVRNFINDSFWFGQQACSSPRTVIWLNHIDCQHKIQLFWKLVQETVNRFDHGITDADIMNKFLAEQSLMIEIQGVKHINTENNILNIVRLPYLKSEIKKLHCGNGIFFEYFAHNFSEFINLIQPNDQTITYYGINKEELIEVLMEKPNGIDRIVPIGQALDFNYIWDGYNFLNYLTREITVG